MNNYHEMKGSSKTLEKAISTFENDLDIVGIVGYSPSERFKDAIAKIKEKINASLFNELSEGIDEEIENIFLQGVRAGLIKGAKVTINKDWKLKRDGSLELHSKEIKGQKQVYLSDGEKHTVYFYFSPEELGFK